MITQKIKNAQEVVVEVLKVVDVQIEHLDINILNK
jgi:hypothetical protein